MTYIGKALPLREDLRFAQGRGAYVHDLAFPGTLHLAVLRSTRAHARVLSVDGTRALALPGVVGFFGPRELAPLLKEPPMFPPDPSLAGLGQRPLAGSVVRFAGEPVACVVAQDRYRAEDALEAVRVEYEPLPVLVDAEEAARSDTWLFPERASNVLARVGYRTGLGRDALRQADRVVEARLSLARVAPSPLEPRAVLAVPDADTGILTVYATTQGVHHLRHGLAVVLGLAPERVRVVAPDVGGGFGAKNRLYPEDALVAYLALQLGRPVKWSADRREEFLATNQAREQIHEAAMGVTSDGRIVAVADRFWHDNGAYFVEGLVVPTLTAGTLPGPYRVPHLEVEGKVVATNKAPNGPYRGAGAPEATFVMERLLDLAADALGMDRVELRRRNLWQPHELPAQTGALLFGGPVEIHEGDFPALMERALALADWPRLRAEQAALRAEGRWVGLGLANYLETSGGTGFEGARLWLDRDGTVVVATGAACQGQGHATTLAQIAAERLGVGLGSVRVVEGDTAAIRQGIGTFGSRTVITAGNAVSLAARAFQERVLDAAAELLEAAREDLVWDQGKVYVQGVPDRPVGLADLAQSEALRARLVAEEYYDPGTGVRGMGTHVVMVEVDPGTYAVRILKYALAFDGGVVVNPLSAQGQMIGGAVQGIGAALYEQLHFDQQGQPANVTLLDYLLPGPGEMPDFRVLSVPSPTRRNPEGFKGLGEGAVLPAAAALFAAVEDALPRPGTHLTALPVTPARLHSLFGP